MFSAVGKVFTFLQARWRWGHGRCPLCNRHLYATFPYYMSDHPNCPVCKEETETDLRMWRNYRTWASAKRLALVGVKE
jgi:hypothetical protein